MSTSTIDHLRDRYPSDHVSKAMSYTPKYLSDTKYYLVQVYSLLAWGLITCALGTTIDVLYPDSYWVFLQILPLIIITFIAMQIFIEEWTLSGTGFVSFTIYCVIQGIILNPMIRICQELDPTIVPLAILITLVLFLTLSLIAFCAPSGTFLRYGQILMCGLQFLLIMMIVELFFPGAAFLHAWTLMFGLVLFSLYVIFQTQLILYEFETGIRPRLFYHASCLFLDFLNLFIRVLTIIVEKNNK